MAKPFDRNKSLEELEGNRWPDPPEGATGLVRAVHSLRRRPVGSLDADELRRLIGQDVGLPWLLLPALEVLRDTAPNQAAGGFFDDDLLSAVLTRKPSLWQAMPESARELREILGMLTGLSPYVQPEADAFLASAPD
ncbi:contact-dependent growth inhibition system immunity protein [Streptomyces sp. NPDC059994]|uniref:contact-dependent growth inhibition system immunity protein n=1 Tax=Streptomyces sp. NPDC059994 TaxID=3347029 RepID=UPI003680572D